jgi:hypothetical protein
MLAAENASSLYLFYAYSIEDNLKEHYFLDPSNDTSRLNPILTNQIINPNGKEFFGQFCEPKKVGLDKISQLVVLPNPNYTETVRIYEERCFTGDYQIIDTVGKYSGQALKISKIGSISIPRGFMVKLYKQDNFKEWLGNLYSKDNSLNLRCIYDKLLIYCAYSMEVIDLRPKFFGEE